MRRLTLVTASVLLLLAGCSSGSDSDDSAEPEAAASPSESPSSSPSESPSAVPTGPDCAIVWAAGEVLPDDYESCVSDGEAAVQDVVECTDGTSLVVYRDTFYAVTGQEIVEPADAPLQDTEEFGTAYLTCTDD